LCGWRVVFGFVLAHLASDALARAAKTLWARL
jgi:hypothetical protein